MHDRKNSDCRDIRMHSALSWAISWSTKQSSCNVNLLDFLNFLEKFNQYFHSILHLIVFNWVPHLYYFLRLNSINNTHKYIYLSIWIQVALKPNVRKSLYNKEAYQQLLCYGKVSVLDLDITYNRAEIASLSFNSLSQRRDARRFPRSLFNNFYINGNKILLSGITNGVSRAVKIARGTRNCCARRASVFKRAEASIQENYCSSSRVS